MINLGIVERDKKLKRLFEIILKLQTAEDCEILFKDLCTRKEIENFSDRIQAAELLIKGKTYNEVIDLTSISSATLCRVSKCVQYGKGYKKFLKP